MKKSYCNIHPASTSALLVASLLLFAVLQPAKTAQGQSTINSRAPSQNDKPVDKSSGVNKAFAEAERLRLQGSADALRQAIIKYQEAINQNRISGNRAGEAAGFSRIGLVYLYLDDKKKALEFFNEALPIWREVRNPNLEAETLNNLGSAYFLMDDKKKAAEYFQQAVFILQAIDDRPALAQTLKNLGAAYYKINNWNAIIYSVEAQKLARIIGDKPGELEALATLEKVFDSYRQDIAVARSHDDLGAQVNIVGSLCRAYSLANQKYKAVQCYNSLLSYYKSASASSSGYGLYEAIGLEYIWLGEYQRALDYFYQALKAAGKRAGAQQFTNIGYVYSLLGDSQKAIFNYEQSLKSSRETGNRYSEGLSLTAMGYAYFSQGEVQKALDLYFQALPITQEIKRAREEGLTLGAIGLAYNQLGEKQKALDYLNAGLAKIRSGRSNIFGVQDRFFESIALTHIGLVYNSLGEKQKALDYYNQARLVSQIAADSRGEAAALYGLAVIERERGNTVQARDLIELAIKDVELLRARTPGQELRASFFASVQNYYDLYIDLLMQMHQKDPAKGFDSVALQTSERARARSLLELINESRLDARKGVNESLLKREQSLQQQLSEKADLQLRLLTSSQVKQDEATLRKEIEELTTKYQEVQAQIRISNRHYAAFAHPQPLNVKEIQQTLDPDTLLLEYTLGDERSYLWAVSPTSITSYELPKRRDIESAAKRLYELLTEPNEVYRSTPADRKLRIVRGEAQSQEVEDAASLLGKMLLEPVSGQLGNKRLLIVADGALQYIPFAALPDPRAGQDNPTGKQPLVIAHEIINLPSASTIDVVRKEVTGRRPAAKTIAVLADPVFEKDDERVNSRKAGTGPVEKPEILSEERKLTIQTAGKETGVVNKSNYISRLPGTRKEAQKILSLVQPNESLQALDFSASRATATSPQLSDYRIIHFATHGLLNSSHPELSGILLTMVNQEGQPQNGFLQAHEIYDLKLPAELIVLSACETGLGKEVKGEGLVGLTRGFMYAGAARVLASLWTVDDEATAELMYKFYRGVLKEGLSPAAALRQAQAAMWKEKQYGAPYYWAAFVLQGEWK